MVDKMEILPGMMMMKWIMNCVSLRINWGICVGTLIKEGGRLGVTCVMAHVVP